MGRRSRYHAYHPPYSDDVQMWALLIGLGLMAAPFTYGKSLLFFVVIGGFISFTARLRK